MCCQQLRHHQPTGLYEVVVVVVVVFVVVVVVSGSSVVVSVHENRCVRGLELQPTGHM